MNTNTAPGREEKDDPQRIDGSEFLAQVRGTDGGNPSRDTAIPTAHSEETLRARNGSLGQRQNLAALADLFVQPTSASSHPPLASSDGGSTSATSTSNSPQPEQVHTLPANNGASQLPNSLPPRHPPHHQRKVSWGRDVPQGEEQTQQSRQKRTSSGDLGLNLPELDSTSSAPPVLEQQVGDSWMPPPRPRLTSSNSVGGAPQGGDRLRLDHILHAGPFEQEAETHILKALEQQAAEEGAMHRDRADTGTSTILSHIPDSVHGFRLESPRNSVDSNQANATTSDTGDPVTSESQSASRQEQTPLVRERPVPLHKRNQSVEQTLFGLTTALSALHHGEPLPHQAPTHNQRRQSHPPPPDTNSSPEEEPLGSADQLANNAVRIAKMEEEGTKKQNKGAERWVSIQQNLPTLLEGKLEKVETPEGGDVEIGKQEPSSNSVTSSNSASDGVTQRHRFRKNGRGAAVFGNANTRFKEDVELWRSFFQPRRGALRSYVKNVLLYLILPAAGVAAILYYLVENPPTGKSEDGSSGDHASASWWILFICIRQIITFSMALGAQTLIIDYLALGSRNLLRLAGPVVTLLIVQSKGWPFLFFSWSLFDFAMLSGTGPFAAHWAFWQNTVGLFNEKNPSGNVVSNEWNIRLLAVAMCVSLVVAVKRFLIGLYLGRQTFAHFGKPLAKVMKKMLLVGEVAALARDIEKKESNRNQSNREGNSQFGYRLDSHVSLRGLALSSDDEDGSTTESPTSRRGSVDTLQSDRVINMNDRDPLTGNLQYSEKMKLRQLLERWEEPDREFDQQRDQKASISAVLNFRNALTFIQTTYPFSFAFGPAHYREQCIDSAQEVYMRLYKHNAEELVLHFETIALIALREDGSVDQDKAKDLVKLFRPDREGNLTMLDFVKSIDAVYKDFRLLSASIENSTQIDRAFENIFNIGFYAVVITVTLSQLGFDPLALFLSLSSVILAFAFAIGSASAKYFEGVLFILVRRPYSIGDRVHVSNVEADTSFDGSPGWVVENVTLFETTVIWGPTNERASLSNGSLANSRIINLARSPQAQLFIYLKIPIDTSYEKILIFKSAVEEYMKARPREWLALNGFRANRIAADLGWTEYLIIIQHRESWQEVGQVLDSKANLSSYCQEVAKQLNIHYKAPPLPVNLKYAQAASPEEVLESSDAIDTDLDSVARTQEFRSMALSKHNIRYS